MTHVLIVEARFYDDIADALVAGATRVLEEAQVSYERLAVPGAFEIPAAIRMASRAKLERPYDGYLALGCVIRGETTHYDYVCAESARGLQDLALNDGLAIGYGILTVEDGAQAWARAKPEEKDRGGHAATACLRMIELRRRFLTGAA